MRKHGRKDANQDDIKEAIVKAGGFFRSIASMGDGYPDAIVAYHGRLFLMEFKSGDEDLTPKEDKWIGECERIGGVAVHIVRGVDDALRTLGAI